MPPAAPPRGRENSRVRISASAIRPLEYFPLGVLRTPCADLRSACHGGIVGCRNLAWLSAVVGKNSQVSCKVHNDKSLLPNGRRCRAHSETDEGKRNILCRLLLMKKLFIMNAPAHSSAPHPAFSSISRTFSAIRASCGARRSASRAACAARGYCSNW